MAAIQMDHFITFANVPHIDAYVEEYRKRGFIISPEANHYQPGLLNRFVMFGTEYIELVWVENETAFAAGGTEEFSRMFPDLPGPRAAVHPFGIGFKSASVEALHQTWTAQGYDIPDVWSFAPPGQPPILSFQQIPTALLPGVSSFAITYHSASDDQVRLVQVAPNGIYALEGLTLVSATPEADAIHWRDLLAPNTELEHNNGVYAVAVSPHTVYWTTPSEYSRRYGLNWTPSPHPYGNIATLHLLATDLDTTARMIDVARDRQQLVIPADARDGFTFVVREYPAETWIKERMARTGEKLKLI